MIGNKREGFVLSASSLDLIVSQFYNRNESEMFRNAHFGRIQDLQRVR